MAANSKLMWVGIGWSVLVCAALLGFEPAARTPVVIAAGVLLVLAWPVILRPGRFSPSLAREPAGQVVSARQEIVERSGEAIRHVSSEAARQVGAVRIDIQRAQDIFGEAIDRLLASFHGVNAQIQDCQIRASLMKMQITITATEQAISRMAAQNMNVAQASNSGVEPAMVGIEEIKRQTGGMVNELNAVAEQVEQLVNQAVMSLQFQDMVTQLLGHVARRLDVLDEMLADERHLAAVLSDTLDQAGALAALSEICQHVDQISQKMGVISQKVNNNPVNQSGFASGEVELF